MNWKYANLQTRLYVIAAVILVTGVGSALFIYFTSSEIGTEYLLGNPIDESKSYRRSLEL
jgi:hypothetical protein